MTWEINVPERGYYNLYTEYLLPESRGVAAERIVSVNGEIPFETAVLGGEAIVPTLNGRVSCKIKEGTQSGTKIRLKGKGIVSMKNPAQKGDEYAVIQIRVPRHLSSDAKEKLTEYAKAAS